jgi:hypothetical protein
MKLVYLLQEDITRKEELNLMDALRRWVKDPSQDLASRMLYTMLPILQKAREADPDTYKPEKPNGTTIFRGVKRVARPLLRDLISGTTKSDWQPTTSGRVLCKKPVNYRPHRAIQSWTYDENVASTFGDYVGSEGAVLITKQDDDYYMSTKTMYQLWDGENNEFEILHAGQVYQQPVYIAFSRGLYKSIEQYIKDK